MNKRMPFSAVRVCCWLWIAGLLAAMSPHAQAQQAAPTFRGATITVYVGFGPGGGFDLYARLLAQHYGKHIPGNPTLIVQNVVGAGSLKLANTLYATAPKDGTAMGLVAQTLPLDQLLGSPGISFEFAKFSIIGRMATSGTVVVTSTRKPVRTIQDMRKQELAIAATGPSSEAYIVPALLNNLAGAKFKIISGYTGTQEMVVAMERGEADAATIIVSSLATQFSRLMKEKSVNVLVQNALQRDPAFPDVPTTVDAASTDEGKAIMKLFAVGSEVGRSFIAPPGLPPERLAVLRKAFMETMSDPDLVATAQNQGLDLEPMDGAGVQKMIAGISSMPPDLLKKALAAKQWNK